jgi:predicted ArsR family transcriptional regulator
MKQDDLFGAKSPRKGVKYPVRRAPYQKKSKTSRSGAVDAMTRIGPQSASLLRALKAFGPNGATREEICEFVGDVSNQAACGRLNNLEGKGFVRCMGDTRLASTGSQQKVYRITNRGLKWLHDNEVKR